MLALDFDSVAHSDGRRYLRPGVHKLSFDQIEELLGFTRWRLELIENLKDIAEILVSAGVRELYIDGSFCSDEPVPGDIDGFWVLDDQVRAGELPSLIMDRKAKFNPKSIKVKSDLWHAYKIELFAHPEDEAAPGEPFPVFFAKDRNGEPKGYIQVILDH